MLGPAPPRTAFPSRLADGLSLLRLLVLPWGLSTRLVLGLHLALALLDRGYLPTATLAACVGSVSSQGLPSAGPEGISQARRVGL